MEDIGIGFGVFSGADHVGRVAKLIADASDAHVTDIVVDRGLLHGAKVIPLDQIQDVRAGEVHLALDREQFQLANGFADQRFQYPGHDWTAPPGLSSTDMLLAVTAYGPGRLPEDLAPPPADPRPNLLRPVLKEGTPVHAVGGEKVGEVGSVSFHPDDGRLASVVMKWGSLKQERAELPLEWIEDLDDRGLTLNVDAEKAHHVDSR